MIFVSPGEVDTPLNVRGLLTGYLHAHERRVRTRGSGRLYASRSFGSVIGHILRSFVRRLGTKIHQPQ